jgi:hypothetical protein
MPHFKCEGCRTRLHSAAGPADLVGDLCPVCGALLEPVSELAEIVGFRSIQQRDSAADDSPRRSHELIAGGVVDGLFARRKAILSGASPEPEALAAAIALPRPNENP